MPTWKRLLIAWSFVPVHRLLFRLSGGRLLGHLEGTGSPHPRHGRAARAVGRACRP